MQRITVITVVSYPQALKIIMFIETSDLSLDKISLYLGSEQRNAPESISQRWF